MKIRDATAKAFQILDEERRYPTVQYSPIPVASDPNLDPTAAVISELRQIMKDTRAENALSRNRSELPRTVLSGPHRFEFRSQNYNLLVTLLGRVDETDRSAFLKAITKRLGIFPACLKNAGAPFPSWNSHTSELPLVAEFIIRNGGRQAFFEALEKCQPSPGVGVMLLQLADVVALNYPIFSESEYALLSHAVSCLRSATYNTYIHIETYGHALGAEVWTNHGFNGSAASLDIVKLCDVVTELCRKASFLHLQDALTEDINLEVNQDKYVVQGFLEKFGFSAPLIRALNEAEKLNSVGATELELKSSLGHLRSFLENLHSEAIPQIQQKKKVALPADQKWGTQLAYLRVNDFLSKQEEQFVAGLYAVISDEAVHPLIAKREYARLARNVIIEYALLFLRKLEQLGVMRPLAILAP